MNAFIVALNKLYKKPCLNYPLDITSKYNYFNVCRLFLPDINKHLFEICKIDLPIFLAQWFQKKVNPKKLFKHS